LAAHASSCISLVAATRRRSGRFYDSTSAVFLRVSRSKITNLSLQLMPNYFYGIIGGNYIFPFIYQILILYFKIKTLN
jgi:hypothetical protein